MSPRHRPASEFISCREASRLLGLPAEVVRSLSSGIMPLLRRRGPGPLRFQRDDVEALREVLLNAVAKHLSNDRRSLARALRILLDHRSAHAGAKLQLLPATDACMVAMFDIAPGEAAVHLFVEDRASSALPSRDLEVLIGLILEETRQLPRLLSGILPLCASLAP